MLSGVWIPAVAAEAPLGERIGPFIFWPVLLLLVAVIVWAYARLLRGGRASRSGGARSSDDALHHRPIRAAPDTTPPHRLGVTAVYGICSASPWDVLPLNDRRPARSGLAEAWGITSRSDLLTTLLWLLREGHRRDFQDEIARWSALPARDAQRLRRSLRGASRGSSTAERARRLRRVLSDARGIRGVRFEAWDLVRAAMLARAGHTLGWLTEQETIDTLDLISSELQRSYGSWEEMGEHFLRARCYWGAQRGRDGREADAHDASRQAALLDPRRGPWAVVRWDAPVPRSRLLLASALVDEGLVDARPDDSPTPLARTLDRAIAPPSPS
ncbi:MAG: DUF1266 domain-containing protein [Microbacterium sp.]